MVNALKILNIQFLVIEIKFFRKAYIMENQLYYNCILKWLLFYDQYI